MTETIFILIGALAGGFVSGLTGFGTGLTALPVWLHVLSPAHAGSLVVACSIAGQLQALPSIWNAIDWRRVAPFIVGGTAGIPVGTWLLFAVSPTTFKLGVGILLATYCMTMLVARFDTKMLWGGGAADSVVGLAGGVLGGLAGLSGVLPTIWTGLRGWDKATRRAVFQSFNLIILTLALAAHAIAGFLTKELAITVAIALPATMTGVWLGHRIYKRMPDARYNQVVLILLAIAGITMVVGNLT